MNGDLDLWEGEYTYRCILTNDYTSTNREIVEFHCFLVINCFLLLLIILCH